MGFPLRHVKAAAVAHRHDSLTNPSTVAASAPPKAPRALLPQALLQQFDTPGPRYTSYPTADRFAADFGPEQLLRVLARRSPAGATGLGAGADTDAGDPLSVYVHVPFCESVCYYCACNKVITKHHDRAAQYLDALEAEIGRVVGALAARPALSQLHFGGGSPTFLSDAELARVFDALRAAFRIAADAEISIEVDSRTVTPERLAHLRRIGFNRISFGVQDFDPQVQQAVHRVQPFESVRTLIESARGLGFTSINADLIYWLAAPDADELCAHRGADRRIAA